MTHFDENGPKALLSRDGKTDRVMKVEEDSLERQQTDFQSDIYQQNSWI